MTTMDVETDASIESAPRPVMTETLLEREIEALAELARSDLIKRWQAHYRSDPPKGISQRFLIRAVAYAMQAKRYGGLKPATARQLRKIAEGSLESRHGGRTTIPRLPPGTRYIREWHGVTHVVEVVEGGFVWNGERHRSLSAIAQAITGARWSGPRFFSVTSDEV